MQRMSQEKASMSLLDFQKTGKDGFRTITEVGNIELPRERAKIQAKMFQFMRTKKGGRRK